MNSASGNETGTPESGELVLPQRVVYPKHYVESLVVVSGTLKEYANSCLGRRQGATGKYTSKNVIITCMSTCT